MRQGWGSGRTWRPFADAAVQATQTEQAWGHLRSAAVRWAMAGTLVGAVLAWVFCAPAAWLARAVGDATQQRVVLADARGTVWSGSALLVLTGGPGARDARALPGRLAWTIRPFGWGLQLQLQQSCCLNGPLTLTWRAGWSRHVLALLSKSPMIGQWPSAWLAGLGTPWNTLQLGGLMQLASPGLTLEWAQGRWRFDGRAEIDLLGMSSRLSTLSPIGSYRAAMIGNAGNAGSPQISLSTLDGALQLSGSGSITARGLRLRGEARAAPGSEAALNSLLNIIGRRDGPRSVISIGPP